MQRRRRVALLCARLGAAEHRHHVGHVDAHGDEWAADDDAYAEEAAASGKEALEGVALDGDHARSALVRHDTWLELEESERAQRRLRPTAAVGVGSEIEPHLARVRGALLDDGDLRTRRVRLDCARQPRRPTADDDHARRRPRARRRRTLAPRRGRSERAQEGDGWGGGRLESDAARRIGCSATSRVARADGCAGDRARLRVAQALRERVGERFRRICRILGPEPVHAAQLVRRGGAGHINATCRPLPPSDVGGGQRRHDDGCDARALHHRHREKSRRIAERGSRGKINGRALRAAPRATAGLESAPRVRHMPAITS